MSAETTASRIADGQWIASQQRDQAFFNVLGRRQIAAGIVNQCFFSM